MSFPPLFCLLTLFLFFPSASWGAKRCVELTILSLNKRVAGLPPAYREAGNALLLDLVGNQAAGGLKLKVQEELARLHSIATGEPVNAGLFSKQAGELVDRWFRGADSNNSERRLNELRVLASELYRDEDFDRNRQAVWFQRTVAEDVQDNDGAKKATDPYRYFIQVDPEKQSKLLSKLLNDVTPTPHIPKVIPREQVLRDLSPEIARRVSVTAKEWLAKDISKRLQQADRGRKSPRTYLKDAEKLVEQHLEKVLAARGTDLLESVFDERAVLGISKDKYIVDWLQNDSKTITATRKPSGDDLIRVVNMSNVSTIGEEIYQASLTP